MLPNGFGVMSVFCFVPRSSEYNRPGTLVLKSASGLPQEPTTNLLPSTSRPFGYSSCSPSAKDRKSTRLNSSHSQNSYAVFCLKKKRITLCTHCHCLSGQEWRSYYEYRK